MKTEFEARVLEIDSTMLESKLKHLGAEKVFDSLQRRYVYDFNPKSRGKWIRLRTNGEDTTLTIKEIVDSTISGTKELEIVVSDFDTTNSILEELGYNYRSYQENRRIRYLLDDVEIDIDTWPFIPTYVEVEGKSEEDVYNILKRIGYSKEESTTLDVTSIYQRYGIDIDKIKVLKFEEE